MPLYSTLFKSRKRKKYPRASDPLGTVRIRSILEDLAVRVNDSPLETSAKEKLEDELEGVIRVGATSSSSREDSWQLLLEAVREANERDHVVR